MREKWEKSLCLLFFFRKIRYNVFINGLIPDRLGDQG